AARGARFSGHNRIDQTLGHGEVTQHRIRKETAVVGRENRDFGVLNERGACPVCNRDNGYAVPNTWASRYLPVVLRISIETSS
ncbi:MAG: hypothetical protein AAF485_31935, partial [Chloroflexota bacterium]